MEVLVAISLILALSGSMFAFLLEMVDSRAQAQEHLAINRAATTLIDRIEADLMTCLVGGGAHGSGVKGDEQTLRILSRNVPASLAERGRDDPDVLGDLQLSEYRFVESAGRVEARRTALGRRASRHAVFRPLGGTIHSVRFRYHDGSQWRDSFDSLAHDRLPAAVEIAIWYRPWKVEVESDADAVSFYDDEPLNDEEPDAVDERDELDPDEFEGYFDQLDEPPPDRVRVIVIPDADPEESGGGDVDLDQETEPEA